MDIFAFVLYFVYLNCPYHSDMGAIFQSKRENYFHFIF